MSDPKPRKLQAIQFMPNVSVVSGGLPESSITRWDADKHAKIKVVEQKNGDVWLYHPNGTLSELKPWMISHIVRGPEKP